MTVNRVKGSFTPNTATHGILYRFGRIWLIDMMW